MGLDQLHGPGTASGEMMMPVQEHIPVYLQHAYHSIPRNGQLDRSITHACNAVHRVLVVDHAGACFLCHCEAWLPVSVGDITDFASLEQVWTNPIAQELQADLDQKKFTWCAVDRCGVERSNIHFDRYTISINIDESCNLACPSCRRGRIMIDSGPVYQRKIQQVRHLIGLLEQFEQPAHVIMSGNGDPLASAIMRPILHEFQPRSTQTFRLFTNGLLLRKQLEKSPILPNITQYFISIDAGSADVYHDVRRPGRWSMLLDNLDYLREIAYTNKAEVLLKFVLQQSNHHDMQNFIDLCEHYQFRGVINRLEDWGTWDEFARHDVIGNHQHADHAAACRNLSAAIKRGSPLIQFNASLEQVSQS